MHRATCHCGAVCLSFPHLRLSTLRRCTCSFCIRRGAVVVSVPVPELQVEAGETLVLYTWGTGVAQHWFCGRCGIYTHHRRRSNPSEFGVNLGCVEGQDPSAHPDIPWVDGRNHPSDR